MNTTISFHSYRGVSWALCIVGCIASPSRYAIADPPPTSVPARTAINDYQASVKKLDDQFRSAMHKMSKIYVTEVASARKRLCEELEAARMSAMTSDNLDEALRIPATIETHK
jgi:hypothetical protein